MSEASQSAEAPQFHLVVRRPSRKGPIAPYRFVISVVFALALAGMPVWDAAETGEGIDAALLRAGGAALFAWVVLGRVNTILSSAVPGAPTDDQSDTDHSPT